MRKVYVGEKNFISIYILVLKVLNLGKHILFQEINILVLFQFISHSKPCNDKNVLQDVKEKVKQIHGA